MGNYYGYVLDGDEAGARKERRNQSNFLSSIEPDEDKPLGTFGLEDGAGRGVGYMKAAAVFHMLERRIGADAMFAGLDLTHVRERDDQSNGPVSAHAEITDVVEEDDATRAGFVFRFDQYRTDHHI